MCQNVLDVPEYVRMCQNVPERVLQTTILQTLLSSSGSTQSAHIKATLSTTVYLEL